MAESTIELVGRWKEAGKAIVFVSHRMEEIFGITDRITVLREGCTVAEALPTPELNGSALIRLMVGEELSNLYARRDPPSVRRASADPLLRVRNLACPPLVRDVSFDVRAGEIVGLAGLVGAGKWRMLDGLARHGRFRPLIGALQQRIALQFFLDKGRQIEIGQLQQLDGLHQLRGHHQRLGLAEL